MTNNDTQAALDYAEQHALADTIALGHDRILVRRRDGEGGESWESHSTRDPNRPPERISGTTEVYTDRAFVDAVTRHSNPEQITYLDPPSRRIVTVHNPHPRIESGIDNPPADFGDHRVSLTLRETPEWRHWISHQGLGEQLAFARAIEDGEDEIIDPAAAVMLSIAQSFKATTEGQFKQARRLSNGQVGFQYEEAISAVAGDNVEIPEEFKIAVRPFVGCSPYEVRCRLRYTLKAGNLQIGYVLVRPETVLDAAFRSISDVIVGRVEGDVLEAPIP